MIRGAHSIIYSTDPDADRAFFRDVLELPSVDVGGGWLIFGLPPAEVAVHPSDENDHHELYVMCDDIEALVAEMATRGITCAPVQDEGWGRDEADPRFSPALQGPGDIPRPIHAGPQ
jgi:hypothetical protein